MKITVKIVLIGLMIVAANCGKKDDAEIKKLPGLKKMPPFKMYSGYLPASEISQDSFIHYWLVESAGDPQKDPLVIWLSEGPYCSSMIGLLTQSGPFNLKTDGEVLEDNDFSWNKNANVLYFDVPFTTGFSYDHNGTTGDKEAGQGLYIAMMNFLLEYRSFEDSEIYVAAEGRSALYALLLGKKLRQNPVINFKGYLFSNPITFEDVEKASAIRNLYFKGFIPIEISLKVAEVCCHKPDLLQCNLTAGMKKKECRDELDKVVKVGDYINHYNVYRPLPGGVVVNGTMANRSEYYCREMSLDHLSFYFNKIRVREAIHMTNKSRQWTPAQIPRNYSDDFKDNEKVAELYRLAFNDEQVRTLIFYGDLNLHHSVYSGEEFMLNMSLIDTKPMSAWYYKERDETTQLGGFWSEYAGNTRFVTVKGAGAYVQLAAPRQAYKIFETFLNNEPL